MKRLYLQLFNEKRKLSLFQKVIFLIIIFSFVVIIAESEPSIKSIKPPRVYIGEPGDFFGIGGACVNYKTLKYWQVEEGKDCR